MLSSGEPSVLPFDRKNDTSCKIGRLIFNNLEIVKLVAVQMNELNVYTVYVSNFCQFFTLTWKLDQQLNYPIYWVNAPNCDSPLEYETFLLWIQWKYQI